MAFSDENKILIKKSLYLKGYTAKRLTDEFPEKSWTKLLKMLQDTEPPNATTQQSDMFVLQCSCVFAKLISVYLLFRWQEFVYLQTLLLRRSSTTLAVTLCGQLFADSGFFSFFCMCRVFYLTRNL